MNTPNPLNGPVEVAVRVLVLLARSYPDPIDVSMLVALDHAMLHSGQFDGPPSLHPHLPAGPGELGLRRQLLHKGLAVLMRSGLAEVEARDDGLLYRATHRGSGFVGILEAPYVAQLQDRARWAVEEYAPRTDTLSAMRTIAAIWNEDFLASARDHEGRFGA
ncbi:threonine transporter [Streptacidiphilus sp. ASG 303]|uniref:ABC-three component system middle component 2 n=1 Tax=Streptacidiphilus sp. ASG 303 TaxID=2896847 RepID=UPI001E6135A1|nr:ABC-three component system middle component 2 [Streptacidiphilus sp. ASG 303]MCD0485412.1 threonine transporter [Streptacidiphilus sp. ASG 303]